MAFKKRTSYPSKNNKYFFSSINPFYGTAYGPPKVSHNCTWYAWGRFSEIRGKKATGLATGNANTWYSNTKNFKKGKTPGLGAVVVYYYNKGGGHVAVVEQIKSNGDIVTSNSGWNGSNFWMETCKKSNNYKPSWLSGGLHGFIYNDGNGATLGGSSSSGHSKSWYINKYGTGAEVYFELQGYGYSHKACCAVLGNMEQESGIRVYTGGSYDGMGSEGLCQWTGSRKTKMQSYAKKHSKNNTWKSVDGQVAYLVWELKNTETSANKVLKNSSLSLKEMTENFEKKFERAGIPNMNARVTYAKKWDSRMSGAGDAGEDEITEAYVDMQTRSSQLYSSDNYQWVTEAEEESEFTKNVSATQTYIKTVLDNTDFSVEDNAAVPDSLPGLNLGKGKSKDRIVRTANNILSISDAFIEVPFVDVTFGDITIGSYENSVDKYPNHISGLDVTKINGSINQYEIQLTHQIREGEDPNLIDKIISKVRYSGIKIRYGDYASGRIYSDTSAIITNVVMNRDYAGYKIIYTIYATSAGSLITSYNLNFSAITAKPSSVIYNLLYNNSETSKLLLEAFPGMANKSLVASNNLILDNDTVVDIDDKSNTNVIEYINYLVSCMSNCSNDSDAVVRNSTYYITYQDDSTNSLEGSYFKISELKTANSVVASNTSNNIYEVTVGYPDNNYVMNFNVDNDIAWSTLFDTSNIGDEYIYTIDNMGNKVKDYSPNLMSSSSKLNEIQKNWWTQMTSFPINASLTLRGLLSPIMLMDYIIINVVFYGQKHVTSGVYTVTGQKDSLSGSGFRTTLALTRVGAI